MATHTVYCKGWLALHVWDALGKDTYMLDLSLERMIERLKARKPGGCGEGDGFPVNGNEIVILEDEELFEQITVGKITLPFEELDRRVWEARKAGNITTWQ